MQDIVTIAAIIAAVIAIAGHVAKGVRWFDNQSTQDKKLEALQKTHDEDIGSIQTEQTLIVYGLLACLKGLREQGCNGPVTAAIDKIEKHLNEKAHEHH